MVITIHNKKTESMGHRDLYIGRGSPLGNPFAMRSEADRRAVIDRYREYIIDRLYREPEIRRLFDRLKRQAEEDDLRLFCFCAPSACHGDVISELLRTW